MVGKVTLAEVARYAGVSTAVVSYVVNGGPRAVAPETADRVRHAISQLDYRPNSSARALRTGRSGIIGLVLPPMSNPFFGEYADALNRAADAAGRTLLAAGSGGSVSAEAKAVATVVQRDLDGLIIATSITPADVASLRLPTLPLVLIDCPFPVAGQHTIGPAAAEGARSLVEHLLVHHHHHSVAFVSGAEHGDEMDPRHTGWLLAHERHARSPGTVHFGSYSRDGGYRAAQALLLATPRPTAVLVASDEQCDGVLRALHEAGLRIPDDIAVVSFDGTEHSAYSSPPMTTARQPITEMAEAAIAVVTGSDAPRHHAFPTELILRGSCGCTHAPHG